MSDATIAPGTALTDEQRQMVADNLGLCGWCVRRYFSHLPPAGGQGYTQEDAYQDAVLGLMRAVQLFDPDTARLSTYAARWMRQTVGRGLGTHEGLNFRRTRSASRTVTDEDRRMVAEGVLSIDAEYPDGGMLANTLVADEPDDDYSVLLDECRRFACTDDTDRLVFDRWRADQSNVSTARILGISHEAVRRRLERIKKRIRNRLGEMP